MGGSRNSSCVGSLASEKRSGPTKVTLVVPTLNEIDGMRAVMPDIRPEWVDQILVVDGRSTDGTIEYARAQGYEVYVQERPGIRNAYIEAMSLVRGDIVVTFSPDGNCIPAALPELIAKMSEGYDMVIASRYFGGMRSDDDDRVTRFGNWMFTTVINLLHGAKYSDAMGIYRAWRTPLFQQLDLDRNESYLPETWFGTIIGVEPLLSVRAAKAHLKVGEIPAREMPRIAGKRKLQIIRWGCAYLAQVLRELVYWRVAVPR